MTHPSNLFIPDAPATRYTPEALNACRRTLATLVKRVGAWGPSLVIVGGLAPQFLVPTPPDGIEAHIGTTDIDFAIAICVTPEDEALYKTLESALTGAGFTPAQRRDGGGASRWQWERNIAGIVVLVEFLCPDDGVGAVGRTDAHLPLKPGDQLGALRMRGAELAGLDNIPCLLQAELLDNGGITTTTVHVANVLPMLVLKAFAISKRDKDKDPYDVVWLLNAWPGGPRGAASDARRSRISGEAIVTEGLNHLRLAFMDIHHEGPMRYARFFLASTDDDETRQRLARYALGTVQEFLKRWDSVEIAASL